MNYLPTTSSNTNSICYAKLQRLTAPVEAVVANVPGMDSFQGSQLSALGVTSNADFNIPTYLVTFDSPYGYGWFTITLSKQMCYNQGRNIRLSSCSALNVGYQYAITSSMMTPGNLYNVLYLPLSSCQYLTASQKYYATPSDVSNSNMNRQFYTFFTKSGSNYYLNGMIFNPNSISYYNYGTFNANYIPFKSFATGTISIPGIHVYGKCRCANGLKTIVQLISYSPNDTSLGGYWQYKNESTNSTESVVRVGTLAVGIMDDDSSYNKLEYIPLALRTEDDATKNMATTTTYGWTNIELLN